MYYTEGTEYVGKMIYIYELINSGKQLFTQESIKKACSFTVCFISEKIPCFKKINEHFSFLQIHTYAYFLVFKDTPNFTISFTYFFQNELRGNGYSDEFKYLLIFIPGMILTKDVDIN